METNAPTAEKGIVAELQFGAKTAKRVAWEDWSFTIIGPLQVEVINESYGYLKDDHTYTVTVEERGGVVVPAECACPADRYREEYDCKHKVALATVGGPVVLEAARDFPASDPEADSETATMADKLATDGGTKQAATDPERPRSNTETCPNGEEWCSGPDGDDLPCFACYQPETKEV